MSSAHYPDNKYRDSNRHDDVDLHDVTDVTLGPDGGVHGAVISSSHHHGSSGGSSKRRNLKSIILITILLTFVILLLGILFGTKSNRRSSSSEPAVGVNLPPPQVPEPQLLSNREALMELLLPRYSARGMDMAPVNNAETFQGRALEYVAGSDLFDQLTNEQNVERYAAVVFYLSTYRQPHLLNKNLEPWTRKRNWLTNTVICLWEGIECNAEESVVGIVLPENKLSGVLPLELSLLSNLAKLDFTTNLIYMDQENHGLWNILPNLRQLLMDDNFFISETGVPQEFAKLTKMEKISLSFNLLQGAFAEGVFGGMTNLIHFEAESNYISGALPGDMLTLPNLTYIYIRRNSFEFDLGSVIASGNLPSLFALWLDGNRITGQIPTAIGAFTGLASLSITDASLTGPIPTEMAQLTELQRLWLYNNQLTGIIPVTVAQAWSKIEVVEVYGNNLEGVMPQSICEAVANSDYELATLSADCQEVECQDCCTECY